MPEGEWEMIIPNQEEIVVEIYSCPICGDSYLRHRENISCLVMHQPGTCCHHSEETIEQEKIDRIQEILKRPSVKEIMEIGEKMDSVLLGEEDGDS
jgi:hypothetical protein